MRAFGIVQHNAFLQRKAGRSIWPEIPSGHPLPRRESSKNLDFFAEFYYPMVSPGRARFAPVRGLTQNIGISTGAAVHRGGAICLNLFGRIFYEMPVKIRSL
jgi:hypothetical protein